MKKLNIFYFSSRLPIILLFVLKMLTQDDQSVSRVPKIPRLWGKPAALATQLVGSAVFIHRYIRGVYFSQRASIILISRDLRVDWSAPARLFRKYLVWTNFV